jgi:hypothetical protein
LSVAGTFAEAFGQQTSARAIDTGAQNLGKTARPEDGSLRDLIMTKPIIMISHHAEDARLRACAPLRQSAGQILPRIEAKTGRTPGNPASDAACPYTAISAGVA